MPRTIYTEQLLFGEVPGGALINFGGGLDGIVVIRDVSAVLEGGSGESFLWGVASSTASGTCGGLVLAAVSPDFYHWDGRQTIGPDQLGFVSVSPGGTLHLAITGYVFTS